MVIMLVYIKQLKVSSKEDSHYNLRKVRALVGVFLGVDLSQFSETNFTGLLGIKI